MSQENVEIGRRSVGAFADGDWEDALSEYAGGVEWMEMPSFGPDASTYIGRDRTS